MRPARNRRGSATLEIALLAPILLLLLAGTGDVFNHQRLYMRLESASTLVAQMVSQCTNVTSRGDANQFFAHAQAAVGDSADLRGTSGGAIIISAIGGSGPTVLWQLRSGNATQPSMIGTPGGPAYLAGGMTVPDGQTLLAVEIYGTSSPYVLSPGLMRSMFGPLASITVFVSRSPTAPVLQSASGVADSRICTASGASENLL